MGSEKYHDGLSEKIADPTDYYLGTLKFLIHFTNVQCRSKGNITGGGGT